MSAMGLELRAGEEGRRVVELVELHYLAVAKRPEVGLGRVDSAAGVAIPPRRRAQHGHAVAFRDELVGGVVDHLPVVEQALEVALEVFLGARSEEHTSEL